MNDLLQKHMNYFPELDEGADEIWHKAKLDGDELTAGLVRYLEKHHGVHVRIARGGAERDVLRRFDPQKKTLTLSELLPTRSRTFQLAHQIALLTQHPRIDQLVEDAHPTSDESRGLSRVALANYFAGAVLMPYGPFLEACRQERYDIDVIGRRFRVGFEQVCHRLTTLRRPAAEGVPFHMIRLDVAGNISKRFSASGIRFARFSGACPRWNVFAAFMTPGMIRIQVSRFPDGQTYFCIARTIHRDSGGYHAQQPVQAIGLGCRIEHARELVYSDGIDLGNPHTATPVGVTCRLCDRSDCEQRAFPSIRHPLQVDENVRGVSLYAPDALEGRSPDRGPGSSGYEPAGPPRESVIFEGFAAGPVRAEGRRHHAVAAPRPGSRRLRRRHRAGVPHRLPPDEPRRGGDVDVISARCDRERPRCGSPPSSTPPDCRCNAPTAPGRETAVQRGCAKHGGAVYY